MESDESVFTPLPGRRCSRSTGTVVSGAISWLEERDARGRELTAVAIAPDLGERYLDTVYDPAWVERNYGEDVLERNELAGSRSA